VAQFGHERLSGSGEFGSASGSLSNGVIGVQLSIPLDTSGMRSARRDEALRLADKAQAELRQARQQLAQAVRAAWLTLSVGQGRQAALAAAVRSNAARLDATRLGQQVGDRTTLDLLNAEAEFAGAELNLLRGRSELLAERVRLAALSGAVDEAFMASLDAMLKRGNRP
jgi:outer membrane protein